MKNETKAKVKTIVEAEDSKEIILKNAKDLIADIKEDVKLVSRCFFEIAYKIKKANVLRYFEALGYATIEDMAEDCFGFKRSTTYDFLLLYDRCYDPKSPKQLPEKYRGYSYSQLVEMSRGRFSSPGALIKRVSTDASVRDIKKYVSYFNKYTDKHSSYPDMDLQEYIKAEKEREKILKDAEQTSMTLPHTVIQSDGPKEDLQSVQENEVQTSGQNSVEINVRGMMILFERALKEKLEKNYSFCYEDDEGNNITALSVDEFVVEILATIRGCFSK